MSTTEFVGVIIFVIIILGVMRAIYKLGYYDGKHDERMGLLSILSRIPPVSELVSNSHSSYDIKYSSLYVIDYIIDKMKED